MAISTNSIIHYTKSLDNVYGILENGFSVFYCYEKVISKKHGHLQAVFPMVSFCDIPLTLVKEHLNSYGFYGIGLKKEWAQSMKMNPVLYYDQDSELIDFTRKEFERLLSKKKKGEIELEDFEVLVKTLSYSKNYEADLMRKEKKINNYRFYDEREWRYVPNNEELKAASPYVTKSTFEKDKQKYNDTLNHIKLQFKPNDISYIIVKENEDISKITARIRSLFADKCTLKDMEILMTRIITTDQIVHDF